MNRMTENVAVLTLTLANDRIEELERIESDLRARNAELEAALSRRPGAAAEPEKCDPRCKCLPEARCYSVAAEQPAAEPELLPLLHRVQVEDRYREIARRIKAAAENKWNEVFQIEMAELIEYIGHIARAHLRAAGQDSERLEVLSLPKQALENSKSEDVARDVERRKAISALDAAMKAGAQGGGNV